MVKTDVPKETETYVHRSFEGKEPAMDVKQNGKPSSATHYKKVLDVLLSVMFRYPDLNLLDHFYWEDRVYEEKFRSIDYLTAKIFAVSYLIVPDILNRVMKSNYIR